MLKALDHAAIRGSTAPNDFVRRTSRMTYLDMAFETRTRQKMTPDTTTATTAANPADRTWPRQLRNSSSSFGRLAYFLHHRMVHTGKGEETTRTSAQKPRTKFSKPTRIMKRGARARPIKAPTGKQNAISAAFRR